MAITNNLNYELATDPLADWACTGNAADQVGETLTSAGNPLYFTHAGGLDFSSREAWLLEAVVSAPSLAGAGERGARLWVKFFDPDAPAIPPPPFDQLRWIEVRLQDDGVGNRWFSLVDGTDGTEKTAINLDWATTSPRYRIRIKRQELIVPPAVTPASYIVMQAEPSEAAGSANWDDPANPNPNPDTATSKKVLLSSFGAVAGSTTEIGFGNFVAGNYTSDWEKVHLTRDSAQAGVLPYWPPTPKLPTLTHDDQGVDSATDQGVNFDVNLSSELYLGNDEVDFYINADGGDIPALPLPSATNPSAAPGDHHRDFDNLSDDQQTGGGFPAVTGWVVARDASGRERGKPTTPASVDIPDRTSPTGVIRIVRKNAATDYMQSLLSVYNDANEPVQICVDVTERHLNDAASSLVIQDVAGSAAYLNSTNLEELVTTNGGFKEDISPLTEPGTVWRYRWPVSAMSKPLREWDHTDPTGSRMRVTVTLQDETGYTNVGTIEHFFDLNTAAPTGTIVVAADSGAPPAYGDFNPIPAAPNNLYGVANGMFVGIRLTGGNDDDLAWGDGFQLGPTFPSEMNLDSLAPPDRDLDLNAGFAEVSSGDDKIIYWATSLTDGTYNVSFVLEDKAGNNNPITSEQFIVDTVAPNAVIEINVDGGGWTDTPLGSYPSGSTIEVRVTTTEANPNTTADAAPHSYIEVDDGTTTDTQEFGAGGVVETPAGSGNWQFPTTLTADGTYTIRARVYDQAGLASPIDIETVQIAPVAAPKFFIEGSQTQSANAVTVSWSHDDNTNLQANGLMRSGASNHNYIGVRISNDATGGAGDCKYRHFLIPACLFTGTSVWKLITTGAAKVVPNIAPGTQKGSVGNVDYHEGQPTFPNMSSAPWGPIAVGSLLHTCTAVVLHSPDDPLMVPDGGGGMMAIQDIWFDTVDPSPSPPWAAGSFQAEILERIDSYNGSTGGFWQAVTANPKIANRNINIENTGT